MSIDYELRKLFEKYGISDSLSFKDRVNLIKDISELFKYNNVYQQSVNMNDYIHKSKVENLILKLDIQQEDNFVSDVEYVIDDIKKLLK